MNINKLSCFVAVILITFASCEKDENITIETENYKGVFVVNEGGFAKSNGSIGLYKPGEKKYFDAFKKGILEGVEKSIEKAGIDIGEQADITERKVHTRPKKEQVHHKKGESHE